MVSKREYGGDSEHWQRWAAELNPVVESISDASSLNQAVEHMRTTRYQSISKYREPLLIPDRIFETDELRTLTGQGLVTPYFLPAALLSEKLIEYNGGLTNIKASMIDPTEWTALGSRAVRIPQGQVDQRTITLFDVHGDLTGIDGDTKVTARYRYSLYLNPSGFSPYSRVRKSVKALVEQAELMYPSQSIRNQRLLWLGCGMLNGGDVMKVIETHKGATQKSRAVVFQQMMHPTFGGLPGGGKKS